MPPKNAATTSVATSKERRVNCGRGIGYSLATDEKNDSTNAKATAKASTQSALKTTPRQPSTSAPIDAATEKADIAIIHTPNSEGMQIDASDADAPAMQRSVVAPNNRLKLN